MFTVIPSGMLIISPAPNGIIDISTIIVKMAPNRNSCQAYPFVIFALFIIDSRMLHSLSIRK